MKDWAINVVLGVLATLGLFAAAELLHALGTR